MPTHINGRPVKTGQWTDAEDALLAEWQGKLGNRRAPNPTLTPPQGPAARRPDRAAAPRGRAGGPARAPPRVVGVSSKTAAASDHMLRDIHTGGPGAPSVHAGPAVRTISRCWARLVSVPMHGTATNQAADASAAGRSWSAVAKKVVGRTGQQCAQRWRHKVRTNLGLTEGGLVSPARSYAGAPGRARARGGAPSLCRSGARGALQNMRAARTAGRAAALLRCFGIAGVARGVHGRKVSQQAPLLLQP